MFIEGTIDDATHFAFFYKRHDLDVSAIDLINNGFCLYSPIKYYKEGRLDIINVIQERAKIELMPYGSDDNCSLYMKFVREIPKIDKI